jgi:FKBP-type peptidyl-prolyl cis-trans isomerase
MSGMSTLRVMRLTRLLVLAAAGPLSLATLGCARAPNDRSAPPATSANATGAAGARGDAGGAMSMPPAGAPPPLDVFAPPADAEREPSGLARKILARGTGTARPDLKHAVLDLRYAGWERNGRQFEGSSTAGTPGRYDPTEMIEGLQRELALMVEGERRRIWVPAALAYGKRTNFANAPKGDMTYEVELVRIVPLPLPPKDVAGPPKDSKDKSIKTTKSGLVYQVITKGTGKQHPVDETRAEVVYNAWTPDGHLFQTSIVAGDTMTVRVKLLPPGWREAMKLMVEGDTWRLWLTGKLAFGDLPPGETPLPFGPPPGPVVFEVRLVRLVE